MSKNYFFCAPAVRGFLLDRYAVCADSRRLVDVLLTVYGRARVKVPVNLAERRRQAHIGNRGRKATIEVRKARSATKVSIAGTEGRAKTRNRNISIAAVAVIRSGGPVTR